MTTTPEPRFDPAQLAAATADLNRALAAFRAAVGPAVTQALAAYTRIARAMEAATGARPADYALAPPPAEDDDTAPARDTLRDRIDAAIRPTMLLGLQDAELHDAPGAQRIGEWVDWISETVAAAIAEDRATHAAEVRAAALTEAADELEGIDFHPNARSTCHGIAKAFAFRLRAKAAAARPDNTTRAPAGCWCGHPENRHYTGATRMTFPNGCHDCRGWDGAHTYGQEPPWDRTTTDTDDTTGA